MKTVSFDENTQLDEKYSAILAAIEGKQTIYIDIIRVGYTSFDGTEIVVTYTNIPIIQRIELTKNGDAFTFGSAECIEEIISIREQSRANAIAINQQSSKK